MNERIHPLPLSLLESVSPLDDVRWLFPDGTIGVVWNTTRLRSQPNLSPENTVRVLSSPKGVGVKIGEVTVGLAQDGHPAFQAMFQKEIWEDPDALKSLSDATGRNLNMIIQGTWGNPFYAVLMVEQATYAAALKRTDLSGHNNYFPFVMQSREQFGLAPEESRLVTNFLIRRQRAS